MLAWSSVPLFLSDFVYYFMKVDLGSKCQKFAYRIESLARAFLGLTTLFAGLKVCEALEWNWYLVFWPVWVSVMVLGMAGIGEMIYAGKVIYRSFQERAQCFDSIFPVWIAYFSFGTGFCIAYVFYIITFYENSNMNYELLSLCNTRGNVMTSYCITTNLKVWLIYRIIGFCKFYYNFRH